MQVQTDLKPMFSYSLLLPIIIIILMIIIFFLRKIKRKKNPAKKIIIPSKKDLVSIKNNYLLQLQLLSLDYDKDKINTRKAYQKLSVIIRNFIFEATNIKVQNYTLKDIKELNMPVLIDLVEEYYNPEFNVISNGNVNEAINRARLVIERWN